MKPTPPHIHPFDTPVTGMVGVDLLKITVGPALNDSAANVKQAFNWSLPNLFALCCSMLRSQFFWPNLQILPISALSCKSGESELVATKCTLLIASALPARTVEIKLIYIITYLSFAHGINILCNSRVIDKWRKKMFCKILPDTLQACIVDQVLGAWCLGLGPVLVFYILQLLSLLQLLFTLQPVMSAVRSNQI